MWLQLRAKHKQEAGWVMKLEFSLIRTYSSEGTLWKASTAFAHEATSSRPSVQTQKSHIQATSLTYKHHSPLQLSATAGCPVTQEHPEKCNSVVQRGDFLDPFEVSVNYIYSQTPNCSSRQSHRHPTVTKSRAAQAVMSVN